MDSNSERPNSGSGPWLIVAIIIAIIGSFYVNPHTRKNVPNAIARFCLTFFAGLILVPIGLLCFFAFFNFLCGAR